MMGTSHLLVGQGSAVPAVRLTNLGNLNLSGRVDKAIMTQMSQKACVNDQFVKMTWNMVTVCNVSLEGSEC